MNARQLVEMAVPSADISAKVWYHGSSKIRDPEAQSIMTNGISPGDAIISGRKGRMTPVPGKVFFTR